MVEFQEVFDPSKKEANILIRRRATDTPAPSDSWVDKCQDRLDDLYDRKNTISEFITTMGEQSETFSAIAFANAFLQVASKMPDLYKDILEATKLLSLGAIKDIDETIRYTIHLHAHNYAADEFGPEKKDDDEDCGDEESECHSSLEDDGDPDHKDTEQWP